MVLLSYRKSFLHVLATLTVTAVLSSCASTSGPTYSSSSNTTTTRVDNRPGNSSGKYRDPAERTTLSTTQTESADMKAATQQMVSEMLANPLLGGQPRAPHIVVDTELFTAQTTSRFNKAQFVDQLRTNLMNAANGRLIFIGLNAMKAALRQQQMREEGLTTGGALPDSPGFLGADYQLSGNVTETVIYADGVEERATQIQCEVQDLHTLQTVFSGIYDIQKRKNLGSAYR